MKRTRKARKKTVYVAIGAALVIIGAIMIWFNIPYSPVVRQFERDVQRFSVQQSAYSESERFTEEDFAHLPEVLQKYIAGCGYIGQPKMSCMKMEYKDVDFGQARGSAPLKIDYTQYNFVKEPCRLALIDSRMFGIPFQGYDSYSDGKGAMKGVLAKSVTLFNQTGTEMDKASLVTFLAESLFVPTALMQEYITFEPIGDCQVRAEITYGGQTAGGIFTFNERCEMTSFTTNDRAVVGSDGSVEYVPWSALCSDYVLSENGIKQPRSFQAVWNYPDGDFVYFNGKITAIKYQ
ncbi:MAG: hypothetical protein E7559_09785 [Ruminococcaceae bacterium]|nr:hypothetical protein [Oscillospiraceae bacterium]